MVIRIQSERFDPGQELVGFETLAESDGAVVSFLGKVRKGTDQEKVESLTLEHYPGLTEKSIQEACDVAVHRWKISNVLIIHRVGKMPPGELIVFVCTSAPHRRDAFEAADFLMDHLKSRALFWKKETRDGKDHWIEPREEDYADAARWDHSI